MRRWRCGVIGPMMCMDVRSTVGTGASNALPTSCMVLVAPTMPLLWSLPLREALEQPLDSVHYSPPFSPTLYLFSFVHEVREEAIRHQLPPRHHAGAPAADQEQGAEQADHHRHRQP